MILMFGDVHGSFKHVLSTVKAEKPAAIILLGDIEAPQPLHIVLKDVMKLTEVYFIHGNHDTDEKHWYDNLVNTELADHNLHGKVMEIDGKRVAGLGGIFREKIWYPKDSAEVEPKFSSYEKYVTEGLLAERWQLYRKQAMANKSSDEWKQYQKNVAAGWMPDLPMPEITGQALTHKSSIFHNDWKTLYGQETDILVTHEAPTGHRHGFKAIDALAQSMRAKFTFHGHHHIRQNYAADEARLGFSAHGVGYRGVSDMFGGMISIGEREFV